MATSRQFFIKLAIITIVWYLALVYLPQVAGVCLDGECGFSLERGSNTIWGSALFHALVNIPTFVFALGADVQLIASSLYLVVGILVSTLVLMRAYRASYGRADMKAIGHPATVGSA